MQLYRNAIVVQSRHNLRRRAIAGFFVIARYRFEDCYSTPLSRGAITVFCKRKVETNNLRTLLLGNKSRKGDRDRDGKKGVQRTVALAADRPCAPHLSSSIKRH